MDLARRVDAFLEASVLVRTDRASGFRIGRNPTPD
jgi:hypothetical protein